MANKFKSGSAVQSGYYFNAMKWHVEPIAKDGDRLPEGKGEWMKVPTLAALALIPILGLTFLMFLPMIGFVIFARALVNPIIAMFNRGATELASTVSPGWQPGEAHFTGKPTEGAGTEEKGPTAADAQLDALEKEIQEKRKS
ncbi:hypothetical protein [Anaeromyxobacter sp. Fw109-5]|uniref:hypothetical protein n=1 Tax=Anaeromyxobacter sp. (strain Fw109-5) TaxID=404589 RepID=UPI0000ED8293|nr:hypothetical protein [Anaeromyxobacter sp. Fw109-5]ABS26045.1 conserved hypothetical protein [Anaeromyxobacter sp. Fw109-5]